MLVEEGKAALVVGERSGNKQHVEVVEDFEVVADLYFEVVD